jgi:hypothetical protein
MSNGPAEGPAFQYLVLWRGELKVWAVSMDEYTGPSSPFSPRLDSQFALNGYYYTPQARTLNAPAVATSCGKRCASIEGRATSSQNRWAKSTSWSS